MARRYVPAPDTTDPRSSLMSEPAVMRYLGTDSKGIVALIKQKRLKRDPLTGAFAKAMVERVHDETVRSLLDGTKMGPELQKMGVLGRYREEPNLV